MQFWKQILLGSLLAFALAPATAAGSTTASNLLTAMNEARADHGLAPLRMNAQLRRAALQHSLRAIRRNVFTHAGLVPRLQRNGVQGPYVGENLAWGVGSSSRAAHIVSSWLRSPSHRRNLLDPRFRLVGLGVAKGSFNGYSHATVVTADFAGR